MIGGISALQHSPLAAAFYPGNGVFCRLRGEYGSFTAFNRKPNETFSISNQPSSFYFGISPGQLFSKPARPNFANQLIPIFYSETWGDYWGFFLVFVKDFRKTGYRKMTGPAFSHFEIWNGVPSWMTTNYQTMGAYLGRVNLVSLCPWLLGLFAIVVGLFELVNPSETRSPIRASLLLFLLTIACACGGYLWFLILYPSPNKGDTIKATYLIHIFPVVAILFGLLLEKMKRRNYLLSRAVLGALLVIAIHNLPAMVTHYPMHFGR